MHNKCRDDMKFNRSIYLLFSLFFIGTLWSCLEPAEFPPEPVIAFESLTPKAEDAADLIIAFTDGDGDVGLDQEDTLDVFCPVGCEFYYNLFLEYYELQNGEWVYIPLDPEQGQIPFYYRVPRVTPSGQNKALNGEIKVDMPVYSLISEFDTARFEVKLVDRALNISNTITTPAFLKP